MIFYVQCGRVLISIQSSHDLHLFYVSLHGAARGYKAQVKTVNDKRIQEGKEPKKPKSVEMDNFQDPQVRRIVCAFEEFFAKICLLFFYTCLL